MRRTCFLKYFFNMLDSVVPGVCLTGTIQTFPVSQSCLKRVGDLPHRTVSVALRVCLMELVQMC